MEIKDQGKGVRDRVLKELTLKTFEGLTELTNQVTKVTNRHERSSFKDCRFGQTRSVGLVSGLFRLLRQGK